MWLELRNEDPRKAKQGAVRGDSVFHTWPSSY